MFDKCQMLIVFNLDLEFPLILQSYIEYKIEINKRLTKGKEKWSTI